MAFELPALKWAANSLEPCISEKTIEFHYGKHHQGYVNNLNKLVVGTPFENSSLEEIILNAEGGIFNNGAQVWNHSFYWDCLTPGGSALPEGSLNKSIQRDFGSFAEFVEKFSLAAAGLFGSGWVWLVKDTGGKLEILQTSNADNPLRQGKVPLLTCDVWEHAYYLDKQNKRPDYVQDFWKIVDWPAVAARY